MGLLDTGRGVADMARNLPEIGNIRKKIAYEEERINELLADIGRKYYVTRSVDKQAFDKLCDEIDAKRIKVKKMEYGINSMKGFKVCPKCRAEISERYLFCGVCGTKLPNIIDDDFSKLDPSEYYTDSNGFFAAIPYEAK